MKLHVGAGAVYLRGWVNVDLPTANTFLASERPDLVERWATTDDRYYARHEDKTQQKLRNGPLQQEYVCDRFGSFEFLPAYLADEILARHTFEHLSMTEARRALKECSRVLVSGGTLRLDVPDHEASLRALMETRDDFYIRHILGPRRTPHGFHMMSYTPDRLRRLVESEGFILDGEESNIHFYPAFCLRFRKP